MHLEISMLLDDFELTYQPEDWDDYLPGLVVRSLHSSPRTIARERIRRGILYSNKLELLEALGLQARLCYMHSIATMSTEDHRMLQRICTTMENYLREVFNEQVLVKETMKAWASYFTFFDNASVDVDTALRPLANAMSEDDTVDAACTLLAQLRGLWYARMGSIRQNTRNADFTWSVLQFAHDGILQTDLDMLLRPLVDLHRALVTQREQHTRCLTDLRRIVTQDAQVPRTLSGIGEVAEIDVAQLVLAVTELEDVYSRMRRIRKALSCAAVESIRFQKLRGAPTATPTDPTEGQSEDEAL
ncbi:hypothetical protein C8Q76DRAFT_799189 [Earliella scabrosa]|nr:hypothetical protein C8Q76DRAFT_799189 [Earliella scabrosa]